jgi:integrase
MTIDDLKGNELWIHRDVAYYKGEWIIKENPKTDSSNRTIFLPDNLVREIREQGYIYEGHPNALLKALHRFQKKLGIPEFDFHTFRKFFCSYAHEIGISEADTMAIGGWATPSIMKSVYRKSMDESKKKSMKKITKKIMK